MAASALRRIVLFVLCTAAVLDCSGQGQSLWLFKRSAHSHSRCPPLTGRCPCGEDGRTTVIQVKQCPFSTDWGTLCEPCMKQEVLCAHLQNCTRCNDHNPAAVCAECPQNRYGMHCEYELECELPELSMYTKSRPVISAPRRKSRKRSTPRFKWIYKLEFSCPDGMILIGARTIKCKKSGQWSRPPSRCVFPKECPRDPPSLGEGIRLKEQTKQYVRYECDAGYVNATDVTETRLQCENGVWVSTEESGLLQCEPLPTCNHLPNHDRIHSLRLLNATVKGSYLQGEQLYYECGPGYRPRLPSSTANNNSFVRCKDGLWHGAPPDCVFQGCAKFSLCGGNVTFDQSDDSERYVDAYTTAHVQCHDGHELVPEDVDKFTCSINGTWEPAEPRCPRVCKCEVASENHCDVAENRSRYVIADTDRSKIFPGEIVTYRCTEGSYRNLTTSTERFCQRNGTLTGIGIHCLPMKTCNITALSIPPSLTYRCKRPNGDKRCDEGKQFDFPDGVVNPPAILEFTCANKDWYDLMGPRKQLQCFSGSFDEPIPYCMPKCGLRHAPVVGRVLGGQQTRVRDWPWQAGVLQMNGAQRQFLCGGVLIAENWVVTAAHCLTVNNSSNEPFHTYQLAVVYGSDAIKSAGGHKVEQIIPHPDFDLSLFSNDIALLKLREPIRISEGVGVVCLPCDKERLEVGQVGVVTGWGSDQTQLREVTLSVANEEDCKQHFRQIGHSDNIITDDIFCSVSNTSTDDASDGDSGGPFVVQDGNHWILQGIVSWGPSASSAAFQPPRTAALSSRASNMSSRKSATGAGQDVNHDITRCPGRACYGGYVRVAKYIPWIVEKTGINFPCRFSSRDSSVG